MLRTSQNVFYPKPGILRVEQLDLEVEYGKIEERWRYE
jgi:hypothetical protein